jgi:colicin import membrane protein
MKITARQVEKAEERATEQERVRDEAAKTLENSPYSDVAAQTLAEASQVAAQLRANARELRQTFAEQVAADQSAASREEREKAAVKEIAAAGRELKAAAAAMEAAAVVAQDGLVGLMQSVESYDALLERHAGVLEAAGLDLGGDTGGGHRLLDTMVRVGGASYVSAAPAAVLLWVAQRVAEARLPQLNPVRGALAGLAGHGAWERRDDRLLAKVPAVPGVVFPKGPRVVNAFQAQLAASK